MLNHSPVVYFPFRLCLSDPTTKCVDNIRVVSLGHSFSCWRCFLDFEIPSRDVPFAAQLLLLGIEKHLTNGQQFITHTVFADRAFRRSSTGKSPIEVIIEDIPAYSTD